MDNLYQLGLGGAVALLIVKEVFAFVGKLMNGNKDDNLTTVINNNTMVMTLMQERMRNHEDNAYKRHEEMISKHKDLVEAIQDHGKDCRSQAEKMRELIHK